MFGLNDCFHPHCSHLGCEQNTVIAGSSCHPIRGQLELNWPIGSWGMEAWGGENLRRRHPIICYVVKVVVKEKTQYKNIRQDKYSVFGKWWVAKFIYLTMAMSTYFLVLWRLILLPLQNSSALVGTLEIMNALKHLMYLCNQCDYKAKWKSSLMIHMKSKHDFISPCDQCDYQARQIDCAKCAIA